MENKKKKNNEAGPVIEPLAGENVDEPLYEPVNHKKTPNNPNGETVVFFMRCSFEKNKTKTW